MAEQVVSGTLSPEDFSTEWIERFWSKVDRSGECWIWKAGGVPRGYGIACTKALPIKAKQMYAHRLVWMFTFGAVPAGLVVCHQCDRPSCVRPDHLFLGTQAENVRDMHAKHRNHNPARLSDDQVRSIRSEYRQGGVTYSDLAARYGVVFQHIAAIVTKTRRAEVA